MPLSLLCQLAEGKDHTRVVIVLPIFQFVGMLQIGEVAMGMGSFQVVLCLHAFLACTFNLLSCFFNLGFPDADLIFGLAVTDEVSADPPIVVLQGHLEDNIVHIVVTGKDSGEPDWHLSK
jgi:hypothetical protein